MKREKTYKVKKRTNKIILYEFRALTDVLMKIVKHFLKLVSGKFEKLLDCFVYKWLNRSYENKPKN